MSCVRSVLICATKILVLLGTKSKRTTMSCFTWTTITRSDRETPLPVPTVSDDHVAARASAQSTNPPASHSSAPAEPRDESKHAPKGDRTIMGTQGYYEELDPSESRLLTSRSVVISH